MACSPRAWVYPPSPSAAPLPFRSTKPPASPMSHPSCSPARGSDAPWAGCTLRSMLYLIASMERPMIAYIASHSEELRELFLQFHVRRLDFFGSATGEDFDAEHSDFDFLVEFEPVPPGA